jgi:YVTN family beta-propeller protein
MKRYLCMLSCLWILPATALAADTTRIYVLNNGGSTVDVIDTVTNKIVQTIDGIPVPHDVAFSPDGGRAYITSESEDAVYVVDTKTGKTIEKVALSSGRPNRPSVTKDGKRIFVCISAPRDKNSGRVLWGQGGEVDIVDTTTLKRVKTFPFESVPHDCYTTADGKYVIVGINGGKSPGITVIDVQSEQLAWEIHFDKNVLPIAIEAGPDGSARRLFVQLGGFRGFAVVDFATHKEVARISFPDKPSGVILAEPLARRNEIPTHGSQIAPDGRTLWLACSAANGVFIYSLPELTMLGFVPTPRREGAQYRNADGGNPTWLTFTPDGKTVYVANAAINMVTAIDAKTMREVARISVGTQPDHIETLVLP